MKSPEESNTHSVHDLDDLITEFLSDGIITAKERAVLLRKAEKLGIDRDEADLYIDAQQQKADQKIDAAVAHKRGASCPYCGGSIPLLTDKCPHCGQNITPEASEELQKIFDQLEEALIEAKSGWDIDISKAEVERYVRKAKMYYGNNPRVKQLLKEVATETAVAEKRARRNDLKDSIIEFFTDHLIRTAIIFLIVVIACWVGIDACSQIEPQVFLEEVNACLEKGDIAGAEKVYEAKKDKTKYEAQQTAEKNINGAKLSKIIKTGDYDKAVDFFMTDIGKNSNASNAMAYDEVEFSSCLTNCVKDMVKKGQINDAKKFIERQYNSIMADTTYHDNVQKAQVLRENLMSLLD